MSYSMCVVIQLNISLTFSLSSLSERSIPGGRALSISSILKLHRSETFIELLTAYISPIFNWKWSCFNTLKFCFVHIWTFSLDQMVSKITLWHKNMWPTSRSSSLIGFSAINMINMINISFCDHSTKCRKRALVRVLIRAVKGYSRTRVLASLSETRESESR